MYFMAIPSIKRPYESTSNEKYPLTPKLRCVCVDCSGQISGPTVQMPYMGMVGICGLPLITFAENWPLSG